MLEWFIKTHLGMKNRTKASNMENPVELGRTVSSISARTLFPLAGAHIFYVFYD